MYYHGMGQHRRHKEHNNTDLVCIPIPCEVCNVTVDKQRGTPIDPQSEINFVNVKVVY